MVTQRVTLRSEKPRSGRRWSNTIRHGEREGPRTATRYVNNSPSNMPANGRVFETEIREPPHVRQIAPRPAQTQPQVRGVVISDHVTYIHLPHHTYETTSRYFGSSQGNHYPSANHPRDADERIFDRNQQEQKNRSDCFTDSDSNTSKTTGIATPKTTSDEDSHSYQEKKPATFHRRVDNLRDSPSHSSDRYGQGDSLRNSTSFGSSSSSGSYESKTNSTPDGSTNSTNTHSSEIVCGCCGSKRDPMASGDKRGSETPEHDRARGSGRSGRHASGGL